MNDFAGPWLTTFGHMELTRAGTHVQGTYGPTGVECSLTGELTGTRLTFRYQEPNTSGDGRFDLIRSGKFEGQWREDGAARWQHWNGERDFEGIWDSSFGPVRLIQEGDRVFGFYGSGGAATIEGRLQDGRLDLHYQEPNNVQGEAWFTLADDWRTFQGQWRPTASANWGAWHGRRVQAQPQHQWLIIFEAHWQRFLTEPEYSFGFMLKEFFARLPGVGVRHRFFSDQPSLERWCRELLYVPEPVVLLLATHGNQEGLAVHGHVFRPENLVNILPFTDSIKLLHYSTCLMMHDGPASDFSRRLQKVVRFPISGYTTSVDWGASALLEFAYLDMILAKGLSPADAAAQLVTQVSFAGDTAPPDSPYPAAGFRILLPDPA